MRIGLLLVLLAALAPIQAGAEVQASLKDVSFMAGHWRGEMPGGVIDEVWLPAEGESMYSLFRMVSGGKTRFTEFQAIEQRGSTVVLLLRHFNPGLIAREEKDAPLVWDVEELSANRVQFREQGTTTRLEYARSGDELTVTLIKERDGKAVRSPFRFKLTGAK